MSQTAYRRRSRPAAASQLAPAFWSSRSRRPREGGHGAQAARKPIGSRSSCSRSGARACCSCSRRSCAGGRPARPRPSRPGQRSRRAGLPAQTSPGGHRPRDDRAHADDGAGAHGQALAQQRTSADVGAALDRDAAGDTGAGAERDAVPTTSSCVSTTAGITATCEPSSTSAVRTVPAWRTDPGPMEAGLRDDGGRVHERRVALGRQREPRREIQPPQRVARRRHGRQDERVRMVARPHRKGR